MERHIKAAVLLLVMVGVFAAMLGIVGALAVGPPWLVVTILTVALLATAYYGCYHLVGDERETR